MANRDDRGGKPSGTDADPADMGLGKRGHSQTGEDEGPTEHADEEGGGQVASQLDLKSGEPEATDD
jgi:hypothetical protein